MPTDEEKNEYKKNLNAVIAKTLEQLAMIHYDKEIKGCLVLVIGTDHVFRLMEAYGSDTALAMNAAIDIAKSNVINTLKSSTMPAEDK